MRFIPVSSLDHIEPPEPFVNALHWHQFFPTVSNQNASSDESRFDEATRIDRCFAESNTFFLGDDYIHCTNDDEGFLSDDSLDLELGLLEAVQDIARTLAKTSVRRVVSEPSIPHRQ